jgi:hypothetical protein
MRRQLLIRYFYCSANIGMVTERRRQKKKDKAIPVTGREGP